MNKMGFWIDETDGDLNWGKVVPTLVILVVAVWFVFSSFVIVPAGHRAVVLKLGAVEDRVLGEGFNTITPFIQDAIIMDVRTLKYEVKASAATKDLLDVGTTIAVNYHLTENSVNDVYQTVGVDFEDKLIAPAVQEVVKAITANFEAGNLITERPLVKQQIDEALHERLAPRGIYVETISLTDFTFPEKFNAAIVDKQTAVQLKLKAENDLQRIEVEARQAVAKAEGEAEAIRVINEQLQRSPQYNQYVAVAKWNGIMPLVVGGAMPLINIPMGVTA